MSLRQALTILLGTVAASNIHTLPFNYDPTSPEGPLGWRNVNTTGNEWEKYKGLDYIDLDVEGNECKSTRRPSPINLVANAPCNDTHEILTRKINVSIDCQIDSLEFYSTPHALRADFPLDDTTCLRPTVDLPNGYPSKWLAQHMELHLRSEHVLDGRRYDGELQMFHLGQEAQKRELAAVSVLLDATGYEDNVKLQQYIDRWEAAAQHVTNQCQTKRNLQDYPTVHGSKNTSPSQQHVSQARSALQDRVHWDSVATELAPAGYAPRRKLFPYDIWPTIYFYRYKGSITSPPCTEIVAWRVLDEPLVISRRQFKALAKLLNGHVDPSTCKTGTSKTSPTGESFRPLQELNNEKQELVHCTSDDFGFRRYPPDQV